MIYFFLCPDTQPFVMASNWLIIWLESHIYMHECLVHIMAFKRRKYSWKTFFHILSQGSFINFYLTHWGVLSLCDNFLYENFVTKGGGEGDQKPIFLLTSLTNDPIWYGTTELIFSKKTKLKQKWLAYRLAQKSKAALSRRRKKRKI